jgi:hypothetical protein
MYKKFVNYVKPIMLLPMLLMVGCDWKRQTGGVAIEEDIVLDDAHHESAWIVDEIVPLPEPLPEEIAGERPSTDHIWVPGEWKRDQDEWAWESGRWMKPPHKHARWMKGHWRMETGRWRWAPSNWVLTDRQYHSNEIILPPEPRAEVVPPKPSDTNRWIPGFWDWDGHWYWVGGYWTDKPHPDAEWEAGHWDAYGENDGYRWIGGHWRLKK